MAGGSSDEADVRGRTLEQDGLGEDPGGATDSSVSLDEQLDLSVSHFPHL